MKVIFLDFDGVLLTLRTRFGSNGKSFSACSPDPLTCGLLQRVCKTGVKIVVSSTWREFGETWKQKLREGDLLEYIYPTDPTTPSFKSGTDSRPREIEDWLSRHPEVTDYQIIDDDHWDWTPHQDERWVRCLSQDGLMSAEMRQLAEWAGLLAGNASDWPTITTRRPHITPSTDESL